MEGVEEMDGKLSESPSAITDEKTDGKVLEHPLAVTDEKTDDAVVETDSVGKANEENKAVTFSRERKKSKYLSPPYTTLSKGLKSSLSLSIESETEGAAGLENGSGGTLTKKRSPESPRMRKQKRVVEEVADVAMYELLTEFYSSALDAFFLKKSQTHGLIKRFFLEVRIHRSLVNHEVLGEYLVRQLDGTPDSPREKIHVTDHRIPEVVVDGKKRKRAVFANPESNTAAATGVKEIHIEEVNGENLSRILLKSPPEGKLNHPLSKGVTEKKKRKRRKKEQIFGSGETMDAVAANGISITNVESNKETSTVKVPMNFSSGQEMHATIHTKSEGGVVVGKKRKWKKDAKLKGASSTNGMLGTGASAANGMLGQNVEVSFDAIPLNYYSPGPKMQVIGLAVPESSAEGKKRKRKKEPTLSNPDIKAPNAANGLLSHTVEANAEASSAKHVFKTAAGEKMHGTNYPTSEELTKGQANHVEADGKVCSATLLLNFGPGVPVPTKDALVTVFREFGTLNELDTKIIKDSGCAQVVYVRSVDAEEAFNNLQSNSPFGPATECYLIQRGLATCKDSSQCPPPKRRRRRRSASSKNSTRGKEAATSSGDPKHDIKLPGVPLPTMEMGNPSAQLSIPPPLPGESPPIQLIRQNLEKMTSMLETSGDNLSLEVRAKLETEIKKLLNKVTTMAGSPPSS